MVFAKDNWPQSPGEQFRTMDLLAAEHIKQKQIWDSVKIIESSLKIKKNSKSWRDNGVHFRLAADCHNKPGTVNFALAWYQQGRRVSRNKFGF